MGTRQRNQGTSMRKIFAILMLLAAAGLAQAGGIKSQPVQFAKGTSSATIKGSLKGDQTIDYTLRAKAGQTMSVTLATKHGANYFNVLPPGSNDVALFVGSSGGNEWTGALPADGEYKVRVYLMRSAARRGETANYTLTVGITGAAHAPGRRISARPRPATPRSRARITTPPARCPAGWATTSRFSASSA
jgi:hypothetical protein